MVLSGYDINVIGILWFYQYMTTMTLEFYGLISI